MHFLVLLQDLVILHKFWKQPIFFTNSKLKFILHAFKISQSSICQSEYEFLSFTDTNKKIHTILEDFIVLTLRALSLSRTNKQTNKTIHSDIDIKAPGLHTIQYNNIYKTVVIMVIIMKTTKIIYIVDLVHHMERWLLRKTLSRVKTTFKGNHNQNCKIS